MKVVNLDLAKKLSRKKLIKGQTAKMYEKSNNCTIYDLKDNTKNAYCSYDAPNLIELKHIAEWLKFSDHFVGITDVNEYANKLLSLLKYNKINLEYVRI